MPRPYPVILCICNLDSKKHYSTARSGETTAGRKQVLFRTDQFQEGRFIQHRDAERFRLVQLASRRFAREHVIRFFADASRGFSAVLFDQGFRLFSAEGGKRSGYDDGLAGDRAFRDFRDAAFRRYAVTQKRIDLCGDGRIPEEGKDAFGNDFPDIIDGEEILP